MVLGDRYPEKHQIDIYTITGPGGSDYGKPGVIKYTLDYKTGAIVSSSEFLQEWGYVQDIAFDPEKKQLIAWSPFSRTVLVGDTKTNTTVSSSGVNLSPETVVNAFDAARFDGKIRVALGGYEVRSPDSAQASMTMVTLEPDDSLVKATTVQKPFFSRSEVTFGSNVFLSRTNTGTPLVLFDTNRGRLGFDLALSDVFYPDFHLGEGRQKTYRNDLLIVGR